MDAKVRRLAVHAKIIRLNISILKALFRLGTMEPETSLFGIGALGPQRQVETRYKPSNRGSCTWTYKVRNCQAHSCSCGLNEKLAARNNGYCSAKVTNIP